MRKARLPLVARSVAVIALFAASGCTARVDLPRVHGPSHVTTTIHYSGVRAAARRFPDYSGIDRRTLEGSE